MLTVHSSESHMHAQEQRALLAFAPAARRQ